MQGAEGEVAGFGDAQGRLDGLEVAHLADQHHVGILPQGGAQGHGEAFGVGVQLALVDQAVLVLVQVFDRILDGEDVLVALAVDLVDHRRQGGRLAGAGGAGDQHQAARLLADLLDHRGQVEVAEGLDLVGDGPEHRGHRAALVEDVGAEAGEPLDAEREVELEVFLETVLLDVGEDRVGDLLGVGGGERRQVELAQMPVDPDLGRRVGGQVEVGASLLDHRLQKRIEGRRHEENLPFEHTRRRAKQHSRVPAEQRRSPSRDFDKSSGDRAFPRKPPGRAAATAARRKRVGRMRYRSAAMGGLTKRMSTGNEETATTKSYDSRLMRRLLAYVVPHRGLAALALACLLLFPPASSWSGR